MSMKNSNDTIGTGTLDILACSAVSQATAPPRIVPRKALNTRTEPTQETRSKTFYFRPSNAVITVPYVTFRAVK